MTLVEIHFLLYASLESGVAPAMTLRGGALDYSSCACITRSLTVAACWFVGCGVRSVFMVGDYSGFASQYASRRARSFAFTLASPV